MPYTPTSWNSGGAPGIDASELNNLETQYTESVNSLNQDLFTAFVLTGLVATKDGVTASQLDVTAGTAYLLQTDNSLRRRAANSATYSTTGHPSTTMYLDMNPDGTFSWSTTHSAVTNSIYIASVTTDASANISSVADQRSLGTTLFPGSSVNPVEITHITSGSQPVMVQGAGSYAGYHVFIQSGTPTGAVKGDVWAKTPF